MRTSHLLRLKEQGRKSVMVTAYDYPSGRLADEAGVDIVLVGDSLGNAVLGFDNTISVTMEQMIHHSAAVSRGVGRAILAADMPFMSYKVSCRQGLRNAGRLIQEGAVEAVKLEGGREAAETIHAIVQAGIPVMGHIGLIPQSIHAMGGYRVQGRDEQTAGALMDDALALQDAGCFSIVLECMPADLGRRISQRLTIPTIGIGAGADCDGQVLVLNDLLGLSFEKPPKFVKKYAQTGDSTRAAIERFAEEVRDGQYPGPEHAYE